MTRTRGGAVVEVAKVVRSQNILSGELAGVSDRLDGWGVVWREEESLISASEFVTWITYFEKH